MAFTINKNLIFIDSMQFMDSSLDVLLRNFSDNDFKHLSQEFSGYLLKLVNQKGVHPYEYNDSFEKFLKNNQLIDLNFIVLLKMNVLVKKDYLHANNVWNMFKMNAMGDYRDLYLKVDALVLADVFEMFIKRCL